MTLDQICAQILDRPTTPHRRLVAVVGPPASGKSTLAQIIAAHLRDQGEDTSVVPMDGFHLDDALLKIDGTQNRKGAPNTFDAYGFVRLVQALQSHEQVVFPVFDRNREIAIAGAGRVEAACRTVIVEGNYLLLNAPPWTQLHDLWSFSIALRPPIDTLTARLHARWAEHGKPDAQTWIDTNDMPNITTVLNQSAPADVTLSESPK
ncbi:nucleoside/nucleotide kinase family protein [Tateyamaria omphalii]|uniref:nucleoside/nucleotide kinase family protein n=1 Tax=Tateyamaria omphalii TaxID=299262 RepID=UPI001C99988B|nr:nucleoside/nucleotide kinase family protein [Tateyamaria omphalii]MBY5935280.1 nucleoside/nucleotide kinase family protein [Tateyamaria omphalii]